MTILEQMNRFSDRCGKEIVVNLRSWRYYRLGSGPTIFWLTGGLFKVITLPEAERAEWVEAIKDIMQNDLSRADVISHFAIAADLIRKGIVNPSAYNNWTGCAIVLSSENDPTQNKKDIPRYEKLFGRTVKVVNMGDMGHTAALFNPDEYFKLLEKALA